MQFFDSDEVVWAEMEVLLAGASLTKIRGIKYKAVQDKKPLHAAGNRPISIQRGNRTFEGEIKVLKGALDDMNIAAVAAGGDDILDVSFDIVITYLPAPGRAVQIDTCIGVDILSFEKGWEQGATNMDITMPIVFLDLKSA